MVVHQLVEKHCDNDIKRVTSGYQHFTGDIWLTTTGERRSPWINNILSQITDKAK